MEENKSCLPNTIIICGMAYEVVETEIVSKEELANAEIDLFHGIINVDSTMTDDRKKISLIHEVLHGICDGLGLSELGQNESAIQGIASSLYNTFKGNSIF